MAYFNEQWNWQKKYLPEVGTILNKIAHKFIKIDMADFVRDTEEACDFTIKIKSSTVAVRLRDYSYYKYGDITIRYASGGRRTEIHKLREGMVDLYFYGWVSNGKIHNWVLWDVKKAIESNLFEKQRKVIVNKDEMTAFICISLNELKSHNCLICDQSGHHDVKLDVFC